MDLDERIIFRLIFRYGRGFERDKYSKLSLVQAQFLLHPFIADNKDGRGEYTCRLEFLLDNDSKPIPSISDITIIGEENLIGLSIKYIETRRNLLEGINLVNKLLLDEPKSGLNTYQLKDNSKVVMAFSCIKK